MLTVADDGDRVEAELTVGELRCPGCGGRLRRWGWGRRRQVRFVEGCRWIRPRRTRCADCRLTHLLVPTCMLWRRADAVEVVATALFARAAGAGAATIAARLGRPHATVRRWLARFEERADAIAVAVTRLAYQLDANFAVPRLGRWPEHTRTPAQHALAVLQAAAASATSRYERAACPWHVLSALTGARLLAPG